MPIGIAMRLIHTRNLPSFDGFAVSQIRPIAVSVNASTMRADIRITPTPPAPIPNTSVQNTIRYICAKRNVKSFPKSPSI